jgi:hypothetical protein
LLERSPHRSVHGVLRHDVLSIELTVWGAVEVDEKVLGHVLK